VDIAILQGGNLGKIIWHLVTDVKINRLVMGCYGEYLIYLSSAKFKKLKCLNKHRRNDEVSGMIGMM